MRQEKWWKQAVFYQIYMPSFCDGNGDGIGDFKGITSKLPYLKELGIDCIWLTPFYKSPKVDNGYDIADYYSVDEDYGTMEDFDAFIKTAKAIGIRVIADIVLNHTSSEHEWFKESRSSIDNPKRDWYIWKDPVEGKEPNNWQSFFGEKAWEYDEATKQYYYHGFAKEQVDLNWSNAEMKQEVFKMLEFWINKGISGFRLDVINFLTVSDDLTDNPYDEKGEQEHKYDVDQEGIFEIMQELRTFINQYDDLFLVGEVGSEELDKLYSYVGEDKLHTTFNFNLGSKKSFELEDFYKEIESMHKMYQDQLPTLFFGSHDMARFPSRFELTDEGVKMIATFMLTFRGVPFIYFGDEIGMRNLVYKDIEMARDIQGVIAYNQSIEEGKSIEEAMEALNKAGRDKSRNVMQWEGVSHAGFSSQEPWIATSEDYEVRNVVTQREDAHSVWNFYKELLALRKQYLALSLGKCIKVDMKKGVIYYVKEYEEQKIAVVLNFSEEKMALSELGLNSDRILLANKKITETKEILPQSAIICLI